MAIPDSPGNNGRSLRVTLLFLVCYAAKNALFYGLIGSSAEIDLFFLHFFPILVFTCLLFGAVMMRSKVVFIAIYTVNVIYLLFITAYFYHFNDFTHLDSVYTLFGEGMEVLRSGSFVFKQFFLIGLLDLPAFLYVTARFQQVSTMTKAVCTFRCMLALVLIIVLFHTGLYLYSNDARKSSTGEGWSYTLAMRHGLAVLNAVEIFRIRQTLHLANRRISYGDVYATAAGAAPQANILMIQVESLDANIVNYLHDNSPVTPFLHALQKESIYYPYTLSYRSAGGTSDCELAVLNSIEPFGQKPVMRSDTYYYPNSVVKQLPEAAFETAAFHGNVGSFYERRTAYPLMGFHRFMDINAMHLKKAGWGAPDSDVFNYVQNSIAGLKKHFFYYIITMSSHEPFTQPRNYYNEVRFDSIPDKLARDYLNAMAYTDRELERFVATVRKLRPNTYIFIYGDHTPYIINEGPFRRALLAHDNREFEFVPLFIITPDHKKYTENKRVASYLDFAPTLLTASGASGSISANGVNLLRFPLVEDSVLFRQQKYSRSELFTRAMQTAQ